MNKVFFFVISILFITSLHAQSDWKEFNSLNTVMSSNYVKSIYEDNVGVVWLITNNSVVAAYSDKPWENHPNQDGFFGQHVEKIYQDSRGNHWVIYDYTSDYGVSIFDGNEWNYFNADNAPISNEIDKIFEDSKGNIWFIPSNYENRVSYFNGSDWFSYENLDFNLHYSTEIMEDSYGCIWIISNGAHRLLDGEWISYNMNNYLVHNNIEQVMVDTKGRIWVLYQYWHDNVIGSLYQVSMFADSQWKNFTFDYISTMGNYIHEDKSGLIWLSTRDGLLCYDSEWTFIEKNLWYSKIYEDNQGDLWFINSSEVLKFDGDKWTEYDEENEIQQDVYKIFFDSNDGVWFFYNGWEDEKENGISELRNNKWTVHNVESGLPANNIEFILEDKNKNIWLATSGNGVLVKNLSDSNFEFGYENIVDITNFPDPFSIITAIEFYIPETGNVKLLIYDQNGHLLDTLECGMKNRGFHTIEYYMKKDVKGVLFCILNLNGKTIGVDKMCFISK